MSSEQREREMTTTSAPAHNFQWKVNKLHNTENEITNDINDDSDSNTNNNNNKQTNSDNNKLYLITNQTKYLLCPSTMTSHSGASTSLPTTKAIQTYLNCCYIIILKFKFYFVTIMFLNNLWLKKKKNVR